MTVLATAPATGARGSGPSLYKLVAGLPEERRLLLPADVLVVIGRQLELVIQEQGLAADVAIGTMRFSLFQLHQGRIAQLAPFCRSITVYGEADVAPPQMPGVEFVALPSGSPLAQEWFVLIDSPSFWGGLITQAVPERATGTVRRYRFDGVLTADERLISRANLLLSLAQRRPANEVGVRYPLANRANWAMVAYQLATHGEAHRLELERSLAELPELLELLHLRERPLDELCSGAIEALQRHVAASGLVLYRCVGEQLTPAAWSGSQRPPVLRRQDGLLGRALEATTPVFAELSRADPEQALVPEAVGALAVPLLLPDGPWGLLLVGQAEHDAGDGPMAARTIGVAALLELLLATWPAPEAGTDDVERLFQPAPDAPRAPIAPAAPSAPAPSAPIAPASPSAPALAPAAIAPAAPAAFGLPAWMRGAASPPGGRALVPPPSTALSAFPAAPQGPADRSMPALQKRLMGALVAFDQRSAEYVWSEACSVYSTEMVCTELLMPVQIAIGEGWHRGEVSVAAEHFSSRFVEGKLITLLTSYVDNQSGPLAVIGCAQAEMHELGAIMLSLFMRWAGFRVIYLGQNIPNSTIAETIRQLRPQILGLSATTVEAAHNLTEVGQIIARIEPPRPSFIFGGMAFYERPDLRGRISGQFLEGDVRRIVRDLAAQFK